MNKPQSLRRALNSAVPYVRDNPDKLHLFVDNGSVVATGAASLSGSIAIPLTWWSWISAAIRDY